MAVKHYRAYCWYDNDQAQYADTYGALYNWYAIETGNLCPDGWHVPTHEEWKTLEIYLGMDPTEADNSGYRGTNEGSKLPAIVAYGPMEICKTITNLAQVDLMVFREVCVIVMVNLEV